MVFKLFQDDELRINLKGIVKASFYMHNGYANMLKAMEKGPDAALEYAAKRAAGAYFSEDVLPTLMILSDMDDVLELCPKSRKSVDPYCQEDWFLEEKARLDRMKKFIVCLASKHGWSKHQFYVCLPGKYAIAHHPNEDTARKSCQYLKLVAKVCEQAEKTVVDSAAAGENKQLKIFVEKLCFLGEQLPREILCRGNNEDWDHESEELKDDSAACYRGSLTTATIMEKAFAHLAQVNHQSAVNLKQNFESKWLYTIINKHVKESGKKQLELTEADFLQPQQTMVRIRRDVMNAQDMRRTAAKT